jgi:hypothetical protein
MSRVRLREIRTPVGHLIEYTTAYNMSRPLKFGIVDIGGINIIGSLDSTISPSVHKKSSFWLPYPQVNRIYDMVVHMDYHMLCPRTDL